MTNAKRQGQEYVRSFAVGRENELLEADLIVPPFPRGIVLLVHGSGSSRLSPRNRFIAQMLRERGLGTLLFDAATPVEKVKSAKGVSSSISIEEVADRILLASDWLEEDPYTRELPMGLMGAGNGGAAAFIAAAARPDAFRGIVTRGGRIELAKASLAKVKAPSLLIVGARDTPVVHQSRDAIERLGSRIKRLEIIPGARHLFEEPGTLAAVAIHAASWLYQHVPHVSEELPTSAVVHSLL